VLVLTPIYMAASIQEERDKGTLPLLFTTHLTAREIVLGKWLSRCIQVGTVLLAGLPVLALTQLWGGIDMPMIAANFLHTGMLLLAVGAFSMKVAVQQSSLLVALFRTYASMTVLGAACMSPLACCLERTIFMLTPFGNGPGNYTWMWIAAAVLGIVYASLSPVYLFWATALLERRRQEETPRVQIEPAITNRRNRFWRWPKLPENVVAWKECYLDRTVWHTQPYGALVLVFVPLIWVWFAERDVPTSRLLHESVAWSETVLFGCLGIYVLLVSVRLAGCIVRERQQRTLETLLTLPVMPRAFLYQKLVGNLRRHWTWFLPAGAAWLMLLLFGEGRLAVGLVLPIVMAVHLAFFAMLGLFLSVVCRSALSANVSLGLILAFLLFAVPIFSSFVDFSATARALVRGVNPVACWITIAANVWRPGENAAAPPEIIPSVLLYVAAALTLWELACQRFMRDPIGA